MTEKEKKRPTVVLNNIESDGFLDFNSKHDSKQVIEILNKMMDG